MKHIYLILFLATIPLSAQNSVARDWNEEILNAIRNDFARPTVHARNLFHSSIIFYDSWSIFNDTAAPLFLGRNFRGYFTPFNGIEDPTDVNEATKQIMSYATYRLMVHRFENSPGHEDILQAINQLMSDYGYDIDFVSTDYSNGSYPALGNYLGEQMILFGQQDNSNEANDYENEFYEPVNDPLILVEYEDNDFIDPDRWQPLAFDLFCDQSGNCTPTNTPDFLSPEWGEVIPFALSEDDLTILNNGFDCYIYNDPGAPVYIQESADNGFTDPYKWHFSLVASWSSHLDPSNSEYIDISPASFGNVLIDEFPETFEEYQTFYDFIDGGDIGTGHDLNPVTNLPYQPQMVKRADYARVLAEFWADGPDSETPPGHWFTILNYVSDDPLLEKQFGGNGPILSDLEWDVKCYLTLGGAMHDSAITTWGIKGYYDYIRPISAIRYMASKGQSSNPLFPNFDPHGLPLIENLTEIIAVGDPLAGVNNENVGEIKVFAWKGPDYIDDPTTDVAGVDWILAKKWWPYQRASFVTPPFAGYVSGHSTFSRAAAEVLTLITNDPFFPGGMGEFQVDTDFLYFEQGPSEPFTLQWATYRDASDQTSLSRIWGGIHPPIDDIRGRILGEQIGIDAFELANQYFDGTLSIGQNLENTSVQIYPNPVNDLLHINAEDALIEEIQVFTITGQLVLSIKDTLDKIDLSQTPNGIYFLKLRGSEGETIITQKVIKK